MLERLLDHAHHLGYNLRHHQQAAVRTATAVLLAASLAACGPSAPTQPDQETIEPLTEEVRRNLPTSPGRYQIQAETLRRDSQGVYHFNWLQPGGPWQEAAASLVQLVQDQVNELEMPASGDPILHLREDTPVALSDTPVDTAAVAADPSGTPTSQSSNSSSRSYVPWFPFYGSTGTSTPSYRNPPSTADSDDAARGSTASSSPPPASQRTSGIAHGVSGQARGTGSGSAATGKSGASSGGVGGQSGGTGSGSAATGKGGSSSGAGVGSARSGGFSGGGSSGSSSGGSSSS
jgi:hypothetical protein